MVRNVIITLVACLMFAGTAMAADLNVGVANMQQAGIECEANKSAKTKYEGQFTTKSDALTKKKAGFEKKVKDFEAQRAKMDQKTFEQKRNALQKEGQTIGEEDMQLQQHINSVLSAVNDELGQLALDAAADVAKSKGFDLILAQNSALFSSNSMDVTSDVLEAMNRLWKAAGSKVLGAAAAANQSAPKK